MCGSLLVSSHRPGSRPWPAPQHSSPGTNTRHTVSQLFLEHRSAHVSTLLCNTVTWCSFRSTATLKCLWKWRWYHPALKVVLTPSLPCLWHPSLSSWIFLRFGQPGIRQQRTKKNWGNKYTDVETSARYREIYLNCFYKYHKQASSTNVFVLILNINIRYLLKFTQNWNIFFGEILINIFSEQNQQKMLLNVEHLI